MPVSRLYSLLFSAVGLVGLDGLSNSVFLLLFNLMIFLFGSISNVAYSLLLSRALALLRLL